MKKSPGLLSRLNCASGKSGNKTQSTQPLTMAPTTPPDMSRSYEEDPEVRHEVTTVSAIPGHGLDEEERQVSYKDVKVIGKGTFGIVYRAKLCEAGDMVAIKKVLNNEKFKNRELQMMRQLNHPNVIFLHYFFYSSRKGNKKEEKFLNMIMEFIPETLWSVAQCDGTNKPLLETIYVKLYMYQLFRCLAYLHGRGICHRDVKPQNLLLNPETHVIKLCDFGSAKEMLQGETNVAYICSRYYRAPELILGATDYTLQIDVWSAGCVLAELLLGQPVFPGATAADQLVEIIKVLGTPTPEDFSEINRNFQNFNFPYLRPTSWHKLLNKVTTTPDAVDLVARVLLYTPSHRLPAIEVIAHPFFDELRQPQTRLKHGKRLPPLFNFLPEELATRPDLRDRLVPEYVEHGGDMSDLNLESTSGLDEQMSRSLNVSESGAQNDSTSGLIGKVRTGLKKKISIKGMSGLVKTPSRAGTKKPEDDGLKQEENEDIEGKEERQNGDVDADLEGSPDKIVEVEVTQQSVDDSALMSEEGKEKKKKKKKKKKTHEEVEYGDDNVESTPIRSDKVDELPEFTESPVQADVAYEENIAWESTEVSVTTSEKPKKKKKKKRSQQQGNTDESEVF